MKLFTLFFCSVAFTLSTFANTTLVVKPDGTTVQPLNASGTPVPLKLPDVFNRTTKDVWISADRTDGKGLGTQVDPFDGSTRVKFDEVMGNVAKTPVGAIIHLGPGTFTTNGISAREGWRIRGAGKDITTVKLESGVANTAGNDVSVFASFGLQYGEVTGMTLDCNRANQGIATGNLNGFLNGARMWVKNGRYEDVKVYQPYAKSAEGFPLHIEHDGTGGGNDYFEAINCEVVDAIGDPTIGITGICLFDQRHTEAGDAGNRMSGWDVHTPPDTTLYWKIVGTTVSMYSDSAGTALVAEGTVSGGSATLAQQNSSGIYGTVSVTGSGDDSTVSANTFVRGFVNVKFKDCFVYGQSGDKIVTGYGGSNWKSAIMENCRAMKVHSAVIIDTGDFYDTNISNNIFSVEPTAGGSPVGGNGIVLNGLGIYRGIKAQNNTLSIAASGGTAFASANGTNVREVQITGNYITNLGGNAAISLGTGDIGSVVGNVVRGTIGAALPSQIFSDKNTDSTGKPIYRGGKLERVKTSNTSRSSTTTAADDSELIIALNPGTWRVKLIAYFDFTSNAANVKGGLNYSGTITSAIEKFKAEVGDNSELTTPNGNHAQVGKNAANSLGAQEIEATFEVSTAGNLSYQWAQMASSGSAHILMKNSVLTVERLQ